VVKGKKGRTKAARIRKKEKNTQTFDPSKHKPTREIIMNRVVLYEIENYLGYRPVHT